MTELNVRSDFAGDWILLEDVISTLLKYGAHHHDDCVVMNRWRNDDGTHCDCGFRDIVGGDDGENEPDYLPSRKHGQFTATYENERNHMLYCPCIKEDADAAMELLKSKGIKVDE